MKLISMFEKNGTTFVKDENGKIYSLHLIEEEILTELKDIEPPISTIDNILIDKIKLMLENLEIPSKYNGYYILIHCIYFLQKDDRFKTSFSRDLYPKVATIHGVLPSSVPTILNLLISNWCKTKKYKELFGTKQVTPKQLIITLSKHFEEY
ncbi:MAG: hypothetical protein E7314_02335 [Clostridiales bacterium]|nr:hypothetical protein [Clostridiales bacterium]